MNAFVLIGYKGGGKAEVICLPQTPYKEQKAKFLDTKDGYTELEIWSKNSGIVKRKRLKEKAKATFPKLPQQKFLTTESKINDKK